MTTPTAKPAAVIHYVIHVRGVLGPNWSAWFEGLTVTSTEAGDTLLSGPVADQAALHSLLAKVRDLNLELVAVTRVAPD